MKQVLQAFVISFIPMLIIVIWVLPAIADMLLHNS